MIRFRLLDVIIICFFEFWSFSVFVVISFVFDVRLHGFFANIMVDHFCSVTNVLGKLRSRKELLLRSNSQFYIQDMIGNTARKSSAWLRANTSVIRSIIIEDRNFDVFVPERSPLARLNLQCLLDWPVRSLKRRNCLSLFYSGFTVMPRPPATSLITWDIKAVPLSDMSIVGK